MEYCPIVIKGSFNCYNNRLTSLKGCPEEIHGDFNCSNNNLTGLEGCPKVIDGGFSCSHNNIKSLEGCPEVINGQFYCGNNKLTSLEGCPKVVGGNFSCCWNELISLKGCPKEINGDFIYINKNNIKEDELINFNCKVENIKEIFSDFHEGGNKEQFLNKVSFYKSKRENELFKELSVNVNGNNIKLNKKL